MGDCSAPQKAGIESCEISLISFVLTVGDGDLEMRWMTVGRFLGQPSDFRAEGWAWIFLYGI